MKIKTVGELRSMIEDLDDDYTIEMSVERKVPKTVIDRLRYFCAIDSDCQKGFEFEDIGVGDKELCLSITISADMCERIRTEKHNTGEN